MPDVKDKYTKGVRMGGEEDETHLVNAGHSLLPSNLDKGEEEPATCLPASLEDALEVQEGGKSLTLLYKQ